MSRTTAARASIAIGVVWALWHLPLFYMPGMPQFGSPFAAFILYTIALSVMLTGLERTMASVVIATLFHGAVNTIGFMNVAATPTQRGWANAISYGVAALIAAGVMWRTAGPARPGAL